MLSESTITNTAKGYVYVSGKNKLVGQCFFTVKFTKVGEYVALGVSDTQNKDKNYSGSWNKNSTRYYSDGDYYAFGSNVGKFGSGFKVGETVTVAIDLNSGNIQWKVGGQVRHQLTNEMIKDKKIIWVPYIYLR